MAEAADNVPGRVWPQVRTVCEVISLPKDDRFEERPCVQEDFAADLPKIDRTFAKLVELVKFLPPNLLENQTVDDRAAFVSLILVCGEHSEERPWTSEFSRATSKDILNFLCQQCSCAKLKDVVSKNIFLKHYWQILCPKLSRDCWKSHPAAVQCFSWILLQIEVGFIF